jgi:hypothetical protein
MESRAPTANLLHQFFGLRERLLCALFGCVIVVHRLRGLTRVEEVARAHQGPLERGCKLVRKLADPVARMLVRVDHQRRTALVPPTPMHLPQVLVDLILAATRDRIWAEPLELNDGSHSFGSALAKVAPFRMSA